MRKLSHNWRVIDGNIHNTILIDVLKLRDFLSSKAGFVAKQTEIKSSIEVIFILLRQWRN